jgi:predicted transglutaminase-like cysteine proteinase
LKRLLIWSAAFAVLAVAGVEMDLLPNARTLELVGQRYGLAAVERLSAWRDLVLHLGSAGEQEKLARVNDFFNRLPNISDPDQWARRDYWATPVELLAANGGDCEDFALAKYFTLRAAGVAPDRLRVTYVRVWRPQLSRMEPHMVLAYYPAPESEPLILDNLIGDIRPAAARTDLAPTMSFNAEGLWSAKQRGQHGKLGEASDIRHWNDLLARMHHEKTGAIR